MRGYYQNPTATEQSFTPSGWFRTGDKAMIGANGKVFIEGRYKVNAAQGLTCNLLSLIKDTGTHQVQR